MHKRSPRLARAANSRSCAFASVRRRAMKTVLEILPIQPKSGQPSPSQALATKCTGATQPITMMSSQEAWLASSAPPPGQRLRRSCRMAQACRRTHPAPAPQRGDPPVAPAAKRAGGEKERQQQQRRTARSLQETQSRRAACWSKSFGFGGAAGSAPDQVDGAPSRDRPSSRCSGAPFSSDCRAVDPLDPTDSHLTAPGGIRSARLSSENARHDRRARGARRTSCSER